MSDRARARQRVNVNAFAIACKMIRGYNTCTIEHVNGRPPRTPTKGHANMAYTERGGGSFPLWHAPCPGFELPLCVDSSLP